MAVNGTLKGVVRIAGIPNREYPFYGGNYEVTPTIDEQVVSTKNKTLLDNLKINGIPVQEEINSTGGKTVTIGGY